MIKMVAALISLSLLSAYILAVSKPTQNKTLRQLNPFAEIDITTQPRGEIHSL